MKIKLPTKSLKDALVRMASIPGANGASIHTQVITMTADIAGLTLMRYTSEAKISITLEDGIEMTGGDDVIRVAHAPMLSLVSACNTQLIEITSDPKKLFIRSGKAKWELRVLDDDILSEPPADELETEHIEIAMEELVEILSFVAPAASKDSAVSFCFCGVCLRMVDGRLYFMATDKRRCHVAMLDYHMAVDCVIPSEGVDSILKAIGSQTGRCVFSVGERAAKVMSDSFEISVTLIEEQFPNSVQQFLAQPESSIQSKFTVNRDEFVQALEAVATVNGDDSRVALLSVGKSIMTIAGGNDKDTAGGITVDCESDTSGIRYGVPARHTASGLGKLEVPEDGSLEIVQYAGAIFVKNEDRMAFFAISKPQP